MNAQVIDIGEWKAAHQPKVIVMPAYIPRETPAPEVCSHARQTLEIDPQFGTFMRCKSCGLAIRPQ